MTKATLRFSATVLLLISAGGSSQTPRAGMDVAGESIWLGLDRRDALQHFSTCCNVTPLSENTVIVQHKTNSNNELGGMIYFQQGKVSGIAADRDWSPDASSYASALAFYRLVEQSAKRPTRAMIYAYTLDLTNGTGRFVVVQFDDGRRVRLEIQNPDPAPNRTQQVAVSECLGECVDW